MSSELRLRARARALRAARAVTLGSALVACSSSHTGDVDASTDATVVRDTGSDAPLVCPPIFPPTTEECCEAEGGGGFWDGERCIVAVPGPFVPPRMA